jgi:hypothetical protein
VEGAEEHLVHGGFDPRARDRLLEPIVAVVRDADRPREAAVDELLHVAPPTAAGPKRHRPVDQVEVDVSHPEPLEALL